MLLIIDKVVKSLELFIWNAALLISVAEVCATGRLAARLTATSGVLDISDITHFLTMANQVLFHS